MNDCKLSKSVPTHCSPAHMVSTFASPFFVTAQADIIFSNLTFERFYATGLPAAYVDNIK